MPTYLCRGFRWKRRSIRVFVVVQDLDDAAPEWVIKRGSAQSLIEALYSLFNFLPECTYPSERPSRSEPRPHFSSGPSDRSSIGSADGASSNNHATHTGPGGSTSQGRAAAAQQDQGPYYHGRDQENPTSPLHRRQSSNSSRKRSKFETSRNTLPQSTHAVHPPRSSPPSQPQFSTSDHQGEGDSLDPVLSQDWSPVKLLEEYDPNNLEEVSRPYAYVADYVKRIDSSCSVVEEIAKYEQQVRSKSGLAGAGQFPGKSLNGERGIGWLEQLKDQLQRDEEIKWYVVVNGDEERAWPVDERAPRLETADTRTQTVHHAQYTHQSQHQQSFIEGQDQNTETRRQQLRMELGYEEGGINRPLERKPERQQTVQETDPPTSPPLRTDVPVHPVGSSRPKTPKTPGKAFRWLFGRSKTGKTS